MTTARADSWLIELIDLSVLKSILVKDFTTNFIRSKRTE